MPTTQETLALVQSLSTYLANTLALVSQTSSTSSTSTTAPSLDDIRNDLSLLLTESNKHLTAASLACKPPVALDALHGSLAKLEATCPKLRFALEHLAQPAPTPAPAPPPSRLARKVRWGAREALEAFVAHLGATAALLRAPPSAQRHKRDQVLVATKGVWAALERFDALPRTRVEAEREAWKEAMGMLDDCADEVKALAAREGGAEERGDDEGADDGEGQADDDDEDEAPLTATERARALLAAQLVRLARLLLAHLYQRTSPPPPSTTSTTSSSTPSASAPAIPAWTRPTLLDAASAHAAALSEAGDELAGVLEPGQDADEVAEAVEELCEAAEELAGAMEGALEEDEGGDGEAEGEGKGKETTDKEREWVAMWRRQRDNAREKLAGL
ncbi:hypothetical protein JCM9279_005175 [Rhodotorula babjevae]